MSLCFIFRANLLHFPSVQEDDKEKPDGTPELRQSEQPVRPTGPVKDAAASEDSASSVSQQKATQGLFSPHGEVMETDLLEGLSANQEKPCKVLMERPTQNNIGIQTMDHSLCAPETVSAATQTVKSVCEQGTSTVEQNSGKQDATVQTERGSAEKQASAPVDDTESLHSQVGTVGAFGAQHRLLILCGAHLVLPLAILRDFMFVCVCARGGARERSKAVCENQETASGVGPQVSSVFVFETGSHM